MAPIDKLTVTPWDWQDDPTEILFRRAGSIIHQQLLAGADFDTALALVKAAGIYMIPTLKGTMTALGVGLRDARFLVETSPVHNAQFEPFVDERTERRCYITRSSRSLRARLSARSNLGAQLI